MFDRQIKLVSPFALIPNHSAYVFSLKIDLKVSERIDCRFDGYIWMAKNDPPSSNDFSLLAHELNRLRWRLRTDL